MSIDFIIKQLENNCKTIEFLLNGLENEATLFRPNKEHWCLLEVICHLIDEEIEDFRTRVFHLLAAPNVDPPLFDPIFWVIERNYVNQDFELKINEFIVQRNTSIKLLKGLKEVNWSNNYTHKSLGKLSAFHFLNNWLAHDYLHIRQITKIKYEYLKSKTPEVDFSYAGKWV